MISLKTKDWTINNIETILFDKDGTFIDVHYFWGKMTEMRVQEIIKRFNLKTECFEELCLKLGFDPNKGRMLKDGITALYSRSVIIDIFTKDLKKMWIDTNECEIEEIFDYVNEIFYKNMTDCTNPINSAIEFIKKIRSHGIKTAVVTGDTKDSTLKTLKRFAWENLFDEVIGRECTRETKESGVPVELALELLCAPPKTAIMIGDTPIDYLAAKNGGIDKAILVSTGQIEKSDLLKTSEYCVDSLDEIEIISQN